MSNAKIANKKKIPQRVRMLDGKEIKPCLFVGVKSRYMSGIYPDETLVRDAVGRPVPFRSIGATV